MKAVKVAAILDSQTIIINHGRREGMKVSTPLEFVDNALLVVTSVREKMSFARPAWVGRDCQVLKVGQELGVMEVMREN